MENKGKSWSEEDLLILKENYSSRGAKYCSSLLKRTVESVTAKARKIDIKSNRLKYIYSKENLEVIVNKSHNLREAIELMGLRAAGGNYKTINKHIKSYGIDIEHFKIYEKQRLEKWSVENKLKVIPLENYLIENSTYSRTHLKKRLYKEGIKERNCELCGQGEMWNGNKMSLILDHINGIHNDNRLENLRIVCPNCNATLETHAGKNINHKKEIKKDKSKVDKIDGRSIRDKRLDRRKVERPSLDILLNEINEMGYSATGRKYGVSDNAIRKWIKTYKQ
jgi:hypothetical protein